MKNWATEHVILKFMEEDKSIMEWFRTLIDDGLDKYTFQKFIRIISDQNQIQRILSFSQREEVLEHFVDIMKGPYVVSKMRIFDISNLEAPLKEYKLSEINKRIADNYSLEIARCCKEFGYTAIKENYESQKKIGDESGGEAVPIIEFQKKGKYRLSVKTNVEKDLKVLVNINISKCGNDELMEYHSEGELNEAVRQIGLTNNLVPHGYFYLKQEADKAHSVNFQTSYYTGFKFDQQLFEMYLKAGVSVVKEHDIF